MMDISLCYMEAKALLPGITAKKLEELVAAGEIAAVKTGKGKSVANATFSNTSVCAYALRNGLWSL